MDALNLYTAGTIPDHFTKFVQNEINNIKNEFIRIFKDNITTCWYSNPGIIGNPQQRWEDNPFDIFIDLNIKHLVMYDYDVDTIELDWDLMVDRLFRPLCESLERLDFIDSTEDRTQPAIIDEQDVISGKRGEEMNLNVYDNYINKEYNEIKYVKIQNSQFIFFELLFNYGIIQFTNLVSLCLDLQHIILYPTQEIKKAIYEQFINLEEFVFCESATVGIKSKHKHTDDLITVILDATHKWLKKIGINDYIYVDDCNLSTRCEKYGNLFKKAPELHTLQYSLGDTNTLRDVQYTQNHFKFIKNLLKVMNKRQRFCLILCTNPFMNREYQIEFYKLFKFNVQSFHDYLKDMTSQHYYIVAQIRQMKLDTYKLYDILPDDDGDEPDDVDLIPDNNQQYAHCEIYDEFGIKVTKDYEGTFPDQSSCGSQEIVIIYDHRKDLKGETTIIDTTISDMRISNNFTWNELTYATKKSFQNDIMSKSYLGPLWW